MRSAPLLTSRSRKSSRLGGTASFASGESRLQRRLIKPLPALDDMQSWQHLSPEAVGREGLEPPTLGLEESPALPTKLTARRWERKLGNHWVF